MLAAKYGSIGNTIAKTSLAIAAYNTKDKNKQNRIKGIAKENLYGFSPDIDKITSNNKWVATQAVMKYLSELIPALGVAAETTIATKNVGVGLYEISNKVAKGENVTEKGRIYGK